MSNETMAIFEESLRTLDVSVSYTTAEKFDEALMDVLVEPAVGAPLPFDGVSLDDTPVVCDPTPAQLAAAETGVTAVGLGIATYGTFTVRSLPGGDEPVSLYCRRHVAVLAASDLVPDIADAFERLVAEFADGLDSQVFATGASATADMGALVRGVHGPNEVHVIVLEDR